MLTYSYFECTENDVKVSYAKGLETSKKFFEMAPADKVLASDYKYKGYLLSKSGSDSLAILELEKAILIDPTVAGELHGEVGKLYMKSKNYAKAINSFEIKRNGLYSNLTVIEINELGKAYYFGPKNYVLADSCYSNVNMRSPSFSQAYLWRARCNLKLDLNKAGWLAKPYYETYISKLKEEELITNKANVIEASRYLVDYYTNSPLKNPELVKANWKMVQKVDPTDKQAIQFFASPAGK
jgi:tetratricopeptide (TPR) repeat protein